MMKPQYSNDELQHVTSTFRYGGAVGKDPLAYRVLLGLLRDVYPDLWILDYGSGRTAPHTQRMIQEHGLRVWAYDMEYDWSKIEYPQYTLTNPAPGLWEYIVASNVLNVQPDRERVEQTLAHLSTLCAETGTVVMSYPSTPRHSGLSLRDVQALVLDHFHSYQMVGGCIVAEKS